jgi:hypothetical protein
VELVPEREAIAILLSGARTVVRDVRLSAAERADVERRTGWKPEERQQLHIGRDTEGRLAGAVAFVTAYAAHGPVRVAVGVDADGRIRGARVMEVSEEAYRWVRPLIEQDFARDYVGRHANADYAPTERLERAATGNMSKFYARMLTKLLQRAAVLLDTTKLAAPYSAQ